MKFTTALVTIFSIGLVAATPVQPMEPRATVGWSDPNAYKNDPTKKADYEQKACDALNRNGCAGGTITATEHKSDSDQKDHITVQPDGTTGPKKTMHVYPDGTASRKNNKGKVINVREDGFLDMMEE